METKTYNVEDIAQWFINRGMLSAEMSDDDTSLVSNLKLQKLLYYTQAYYLATNNEPLFKDKIYAWKYGPIVKTIYNKYKNYKKTGIKNCKPIALDENTSVVLEFIYTNFGKYEPFELVRLTHQDNCYINTKPNNEMQQNEIKKDFTNKWLKTVDIDKKFNEYSAMAETSYINSLGKLAEYLKKEKAHPTNNTKELDWKTILNSN